MDPTTISRGRAAGPTKKADVTDHSFEHSITSAYLLTSLPELPGYPLFSHPKSFVLESVPDRQSSWAVDNPDSRAVKYTTWDCEYKRTSI